MMKHLNSEMMRHHNPEMMKHMGGPGGRHHGQEIHGSEMMGPPNPAEMKRMMKEEMSSGLRAITNVALPRVLEHKWLFFKDLTPDVTVRAKLAAGCGTLFSNVLSLVDPDKIDPRDRGLIVGMISKVFSYDLSDAALGNDFRNMLSNTLYDCMHKKLGDVGDRSDFRNIMLRVISKVADAENAKNLAEHVLINVSKKLKDGTEDEYEADPDTLAVYAAALNFHSSLNVPGNFIDSIKSKLEGGQTTLDSAKGKAGYKGVTDAQDQITKFSDLPTLKTFMEGDDPMWDNKEYLKSFVRTVALNNKETDFMPLLISELIKHHEAADHVTAIQVVKNVSKYCMTVLSRVNDSANRKKMFIKLVEENGALWGLDEEQLKDVIISIREEEARVAHEKLAFSPWQYQQ